MENETRALPKRCKDDAITCKIKTGRNLLLRSCVYRGRGELPWTSWIQGGLDDETHEKTGRGPDPGPDAAPGPGGLREGRQAGRG